MKLALVRDGIVENVIVPPDGEWEAPEGVATVVCDDEAHVGPGFTYDGKAFSEPAPPVPQTVTPLQMRKALRLLGLKDAVDAMLAGAPEEVVEEWEYATAIDRYNPTLLAASNIMGKTPEDMDNVFRLAETQ